MQRIKYFLYIIFITFQVGAYAQGGFRNGNQTHTNQNPRLDSLIMLHKKSNAINQTIPGYRLQIYFEAGNYSKSKAIEVKQSFDANNPGYNAYISFNEPYYRVRVGDFRTKIEAMGFLKDIINIYPNAFEVKDMISINNY